jgi:hypothetical protein
MAHIYRKEKKEKKKRKKTVKFKHNVAKRAPRVPHSFAATQRDLPEARGGCRSFIKRGMTVRGRSRTRNPAA